MLNAFPNGRMAIVLPVFENAIHLLLFVSCDIIIGSKLGQLLLPFIHEEVSLVPYIFHGVVQECSVLAGLDEPGIHEQEMGIDFFIGRWEVDEESVMGIYQVLEDVVSPHVFVEPLQCRIKLFDVLNIIHNDLIALLELIHRVLCVGVHGTVFSDILNQCVVEKHC